MAYFSPYVYTVGQVLTAANLNTYLSGNVTYLKSQTDILSISAYNNDSITLNQYDPIVWDPLYTSGLGVKSTTNSPDYRATGIVISSSISSHATGLVYFPGFYLTNINVTGAVAFGHSLITSSSAHYAADSGGGGNGYGTLGWALGTNPSGNATIAALLRAYPLFYTAAQVITQKYGAVDIATGAQTYISNVVNVTPNQLLLFTIFTAGTVTVPLWNAQTPTLLQANGSNTSSYIGAGLGWGAATSNFTASVSSNYNPTAVLAMNGINQGGGATTFGTIAHQNGTTGTAVSVTVTCNPGDKVVCFLLCKGTTLTFSGTNQTVEESGVGTNTAYSVQSAVATGASITFTWTIGGTPSGWSADGFALHTA